MVRWELLLERECLLRGRVPTQPALQSIKHLMHWHSCLASHYKPICLMRLDMTACTGWTVEIRMSQLFSLRQIVINVTHNEKFIL
ncbi:unnamed protein product [Mycena citricolor]|uniref:Uncharacterized protein n=1 Tax=Mycena citricolor TaxID=2018698 RepID=A0AAD2HXS7_9AGAR|nr:unnamed protein product [Mycena citricolor]